MADCAILFSGGTDSTCAAAICAEKYQTIHLLTFFEEATRHSPLPTENITRLRAKYGENKFIHRVISTDLLVRTLSYENYIKNLFKHGFILLATPGYSSLSWHLRTIRYCQENKIAVVRDGMTKELIHLPGHLFEVRELFKGLYAKFGIDFDSPILDWDVPADQRLVDRLVVDQHGFALREAVQTKARTTGTWLFEKGIFPRPNVKGSLFDQRMQHDCYPFILYNILAFWLLIPVFGWERFKGKLARLFRAKIFVATAWLETRPALFEAPHEK